MATQRGDTAGTSVWNLPVHDVSGGGLGRVAAIGTRHGLVRHIGVEVGGGLRFYAIGQVRRTPTGLVVESGPGAAAGGGPSSRR
ncbi:MAG: hypothetical protein WAM30_03300 [Candidatus Dormiibacterota bacterium]